MDLHYLIVAAVALITTAAMAASAEASSGGPANVVKVSAQPIEGGRISPMLYGGFIELLDDLVPGMWAEMLNDRKFEGTGKTSNWAYYTGKPDFCDRKWEGNGAWSLDTNTPFNGGQSVKLTASKGHPALLTQSGLATQKGMTYHFTGYCRTDSPDASVRVVLKTILPDESWTELASAKIPVKGKDWSHFTCTLKSNGTSKEVVFEVEAAGTGNVWLDSISLMPSDNMKGWRKDVVEAIKEQKPGTLRWGGCAIDPGHYQWKNCIGDRDRRNPFPNFEGWGRIDTNDVGIDEFLQICELVGAEPLVCLSFADGAESARNLIEYCNGNTDTEWGKKRAENGHPKPYNVKYWQLGNELGGEEHAERCVEFCKAIREEQPDAIILSSFPSPELFQKVGKSINITCPHHYTPDLVEDENSINDTARMIKEAGLQGKIQVGITEWNVTAGWWGLGRGRLLNLECGLFAGRYLNLLHRHSDIVTIACRSNMTNSFGSGMIQSEPYGILKTPGYYVMKLYAEHSKPVPLTVESAPEGIDVSACRTDNGRSLTIFAVNMKQEPVEITLDLGGKFTPSSGEVVCDTQDMRQLELMNHWENPDRVRTVKLSVTGKTITLPALSASAIDCKAD